MLTTDHHLSAIDAFDRVASTVPERSWRHPVASCPGWDVRTLVTHVAATTLRTGFLLAGDDPDRVIDQVDTFVSLDEPLDSWRRAAAHTRCVLDQAWLGREIAQPGGHLGALDLIADTCCDTVIHTWDLATSIGVDPMLGSVIVVSCAEWFDHVEDDWRQRGAIGERVEVVADADPLGSLLARSGRTLP